MFKKSTFQVINLFIFIVVLVSTSWLLKNKIEKFEIGDFKWMFKQLFSKPLLLCLTVFFVGINWTCDALVWRYSINNQIVIQLQKAIKSVLTGHTLNLFLPFGIGDYLGKHYSLPNSNRIKTVVGTMIFNGLQWLVGFQLMSIAFKFIPQFNESSFTNIPLLITIALTTLAITFIFTNHKSVLIPQKFKYLLEDFIVLKPKKYILIYLGSVIKFLIYIFQFYLTFLLFDIQLPIKQLIIGIVLILSIKSILPIINVISELGIREIITILYFENYSMNLKIITMAITYIWVINNGIPALFGAFQILTLKLKK